MLEALKEYLALGYRILRDIGFYYIVIKMLKSWGFSIYILKIMVIVVVVGKVAEYVPVKRIGSYLVRAVLRGVVVLPLVVILTVVLYDIEVGEDIVDVVKLATLIYVLVSIRNYISYLDYNRALSSKK